MVGTRVVVIGGGFGGLNVVKTLKHANLDITLIDKKNHHLFQPLLYQVATAALSPADIATPLREIFSHQKNTTVIMGTVTGIDKKEKRLTLANGDQLSYDYLVIATGAKHSYFGNEHWGAVAPGLKTVTDALNIRERILISFEKAERMESIQDAKKFLNFAIIGAGPTGVEMAGAIAEIAYKTMLKNFRHINPKKCKVFLIEGLPRILPTFPEKLSDKAQKNLEKMGVTVITNKIVTNINEEGIQLGDEFIEAHNVIWAAGNQASPLLKTLDTPLSKQGGAIVEPDLTIPNHPEIFVIGDTACSIGKNGKPLPATAPTAIQQGRYVGKILLKEKKKNPRAPFCFFDKGSIATIGKKSCCGLRKKIYL